MHNNYQRIISVMTLNFFLKKTLRFHQDNHRVDGKFDMNNLEYSTNIVDWWNVAKHDMILK